MRMPFVLLVVFTASFAIAAPVKSDPKVERVKLESFWKDLHSFDSIVRILAVLALVDHPQAATFLDEKVRPLKVSKEQIEQWMNELNGEDDTKRDKAFEELKYYDPQLHFSAGEQIALATSNDAKRRLIGLWMSPQWADRLEANSQFTLRVVRIDKDSTIVNCHWEYRNPKSSGSSECEWPVQTIRNFESQSWIATALAALVLERIGSRAARMTLEKLANGHPDALPTRTAVALLQPGPPVPLTAKQFEIAWKTLAEGNPMAVARKAIALSDDPIAAKFMKGKLPAIKAEKAQMKKWLADLGNVKEEVWCPAFESLQYFRPSLAMSLEEQIAEMTDDRSRSMLFWVHNTFGPIPKVFEIVPNTLREDECDLTMLVQLRGGVIQNQFARIGSLETMTPLEWQRARLAILVLERSGSAESLEVLNQLADGHPDILPTKEAKAAAKRVGK